MYLRKNTKIGNSRNNKVYLIFNHDKFVEKLMRWLVKKPYTSDIELDEIGSRVWQYIDGSTTVYDITKKLSEKYGENFDPKYERVSMFLNYMNKKGWISFEKGHSRGKGIFLLPHLLS